MFTCKLQSVANWMHSFYLLWCHEVLKLDHSSFNCQIGAVLIWIICPELNTK